MTYTEGLTIAIERSYPKVGVGQNYESSTLNN